MLDLFLQGSLGVGRCSRGSRTGREKKLPYEIGLNVLARCLALPSGDRFPNQFTQKFFEIEDLKCTSNSLLHSL